MKVWILTSEYNDYDQYGEYLEAVFKQKPTAEQLKPCLEDSYDCKSSEVGHVLAGGGRLGDDHKWRFLQEVEAQ